MCATRQRLLLRLRLSLTTTKIISGHVLEMTPEGRYIHLQPDNGDSSFWHRRSWLELVCELPKAETPTNTGRSGTYTTIGCWKDSPLEPVNHAVEADSVRQAIETAESKARAEAGCPKAGVFVNLFVFEGTPEILSTWAG